MRFLLKRLSAHEILFPAQFKAVRQMIFRYHKVFGFLTIVFILLHLVIQVQTNDLLWTGLLAASFMVLQVVLGVVLSASNKKGDWVSLHRVVAVILIVSIGLHVILKA